MTITERNRSEFKLIYKAIYELKQLRQEIDTLETFDLSEHLREGSVKVVQDTPESWAYCWSCGKRDFQGNIFCITCGSRLSPHTATGPMYRPGRTALAAFSAAPNGTDEQAAHSGLQVLPRDTVANP
jgi:hypothetical protein